MTICVPNFEYLLKKDYFFLVFANSLSAFGGRKFERFGESVIFVVNFKMYARFVPV